MISDFLAQVTPTIFKTLFDSRNVYEEVVKDLQAFSLFTSVISILCVAKQTVITKSILGTKIYYMVLTRV